MIWLKHKANIIEFWDKVSQIEVKVQENKEKTDYITEKMSTDYVKRQGLERMLQKQGTSVASNGLTDMNPATALKKY